MGKKRRGGGHYCWVCGKSKSNESFSGKGHSKHICKKCASLSPEQRKAKEERSQKEEIRRLLEGDGPYGKSKRRQEEPEAYISYDPFWEWDPQAWQITEETDETNKTGMIEFDEDDLPF